MELNVTLQHGTVSAEFSGEDRKELQDELREFKQFLDENADLFAVEPDLGTETDSGETIEQQKLDSIETEESGSPDNDIQKALSPVARAIGISESKLEEFLYVDPDEEAAPEILIDEPDSVFDTTKKGKQKPASLILLYLWQKCYSDKDEVSSSELKDALAGSGIDPSNLFHVYDKHINQKGPKSNILELSRSGEIQAQEEIEKLVTEEE